MEPASTTGDRGAGTSNWRLKLRARRRMFSTALLRSGSKQAREVNSRSFCRVAFAANASRASVGVHPGSLSSAHVSETLPLHRRRIPEASQSRIRRSTNGSIPPPLWSRSAWPPGFSDQSQFSKPSNALPVSRRPNSARRFAGANHRQEQFQFRQYLHSQSVIVSLRVCLRDLGVVNPTI